MNAIVNIAVVIIINTEEWNDDDEGTPNDNYHDFWTGSRWDSDFSEARLYNSEHAAQVDVYRMSDKDGAQASVIENNKSF